MSADREINLSNCPRCGGDHEKLELFRFDRPIAVAPRYTHWGECPATGEPLIAPDPLRVEGAKP